MSEGTTFEDTLHVVILPPQSRARPWPAASVRVWLAKTRGHFPLAAFLHIGTSTLDRLFGAGTVKRATAERLEARLAELARQDGGAATGT